MQNIVLVCIVAYHQQILAWDQSLSLIIMQLVKSSRCNANNISYGTCESMADDILATLGDKRVVNACECYSMGVV